MEVAADAEKLAAASLIHPRSGITVDRLAPLDGFESGHTERQRVSR
jgi:hypothetical protein